MNLLSRQLSSLTQLRTHTKHKHTFSIQAKGVFLRIVKMIQGPANFAKPIPNSKAAETSDRFSWVGDSWPPPRDPRVPGKGNW